MDTKKKKLEVIEAAELAVDQLIKVSKEKIITGDPEDSLAADRLKNAAATKKLAIFDAFEILKRIDEEREALSEDEGEKKDKNKRASNATNFTERHAK